MPRRSRQYPDDREAEGEAREVEGNFIEAEPQFLRALRGYNCQQVDAWVQWQRSMLDRARQRAIEAEREQRRILIELGVGVPQPATANENVPKHHPRHLRREP